MIWFKKKKRKPKEFRVRKITFIGEQDGVPEQELKSSLNILFSNKKTVMSAYLARVNYGNPNKFDVALCIRSEIPEDIALKKEAGQIFSAKFGNHEHLDIIFIRKEQETALRKVCNPFFEK